MKPIHIPFLAVVAMLSGCATSSQVQEMIDSAHQDYQGQLASHEESISVLKQSAMTGLEKSSQNAKNIAELDKRLNALVKQVAIVQDLANASKVRSAENTVRLADLKEQVEANKEVSDKAIARMNDIDKLYEEVLIRQYQAIADSASAAIETLKADGFSASTNAPVKLNAPIEIVAPDTAAPTNAAEPAPRNQSGAM